MDAEFTFITELTQRFFRRMIVGYNMSNGIKVAGGNRLGKTIIFAQNKKHAQYIVERFDKLYPQYNGSFAKRIISEDSYAQSIIDEFKVADKGPHIAVSVDMLDTGIDVPEIINLVFFNTRRKFSQAPHSTTFCAFGGY